MNVRTGKWYSFKILIDPFPGEVGSHSLTCHMSHSSFSFASKNSWTLSIQNCLFRSLLQYFLNAQSSYMKRIDPCHAQTMAKKAYSISIFLSFRDRIRRVTKLRAYHLEADVTGFQFCNVMKFQNNTFWRSFVTKFVNCYKCFCPYDEVKESQHNLQPVD